MKFRQVSEDCIYRIDGIDGMSPLRHIERFHLRLIPMDRLAKADWKGIEALAGQFSTSYLRWFYGSRRTVLLLIAEEQRVVAVLWVVPGEKIRRRYHFVTPESSAIIACVTHPSCRGLGLYPAGIRTIAVSGHSPRYFIWAHKANTASLRGIMKAGGVKFGEFTRVRWLRGLMTSISFRPEQSPEGRHG